MGEISQGIAHHSKYSMTHSAQNIVIAHVRYIKPREYKLAKIVIVTVPARKYHYDTYSTGKTLTHSSNVGSKAYGTTLTNLITALPHVFLAVILSNAPSNRTAYRPLKITFRCRKASSGSDSLCLAALRVVLHQTIPVKSNAGSITVVVGGQGISTAPRCFELAKRLQLVSLSLCQESRTIASFHIRIGNSTPRRMWGASRTPQGKCALPSGSINGPAAGVSLCIDYRKGGGVGDGMRMHSSHRKNQCRDNT